MISRQQWFGVCIFTIWFVCSPKGVAQTDEDRKRLEEMSRFSGRLSAAFEQGGQPGNYANVFRLLQDPEEVPEGVEDIAATWLSFIGEHRLAQKVWDEREGETQRSSISLPAKANLQSALDVIAKAAESRRVVMINEAHHVPLHREFTKGLLEPLYDQGYRYLALETLNNLEDYEHEGHPFEELGYPTFEGGYYSMEPAFGDLIRTALELGFSLVAYEVRPSDTEGAPGIERRETAQANHLVRFLDENPGEKLLIHLGYAHLYEVPVGGNSWMATRLKNILGIDPLTIDQTRMYPRSDPKYEPSLFLEALERFTFETPSILMEEGGSFWSGASTEGLYDVTVFHPRYEFVQDRPTWLRDSESRTPSVLADVPRPGPDSWYLLQALNATEDPSLAIPMDQFVLRPENSEPTLYLPEGEFKYRLINPQGAVIWEQSSAEEGLRSPPSKLAMESTTPFDWTVGTWTGIRRGAESGRETPMTMEVRSILGGAGQSRELVVGENYHGFAAQVFDPQLESWVRQYINDSRGRFSRLESEEDSDSDRSTWRGASPHRTRESRLVSERLPGDRWRRTMSVSEDGGVTWRVLWTDELQKHD